MYKNQLQELAQRSSCNLPSYSCLREGPDHAPRFKASVNFNGEVFESPGYCSTLRQAEHAAAEVALNVLSKQGPAQSLAARVLDETGVCKNLLQETAQRAGVMLPTYSTFRSGPGHSPVFTSTVDVAGFQFTGEPAKTKKQAEKNAALAAWTKLKKVANYERPSVSDHDLASDEQEQNSIARALAFSSSKQMQKSHSSSSFSNQLAVEEKRSSPSISSQSSIWLNHEGSPKHIAQASPLFPRSNSGSQSPLSPVPNQQRKPAAPQSNQFGQSRLKQPPSSQPKSTQTVSTHTGLAIKPGMAYQPRSRMSFSSPSSASPNPNPNPPSNIRASIKPAVNLMQQRQVMSSQTEHDDDELWLRGRPCSRDVSVSGHISSPRRDASISPHPSASGYPPVSGPGVAAPSGHPGMPGYTSVTGPGVGSASGHAPVTGHLPSSCIETSSVYADRIWDSTYWGSSTSEGAVSREPLTHNLTLTPGSSHPYASHSSVPPMHNLIAPVRIRSLIPVHASPCFDDEDDYEDDDEDEEEVRKGESTTINMLSQLGL